MAVKFITKDYLTTSLKSFKTVVLNPLFNKKLDNATDVGNAGKAVVVDNEGNLVFGDAGVQVSKEDGNKIETKDDGIYVANNSDAWNGTKAQFEALDKSILKDGQTVNLTDDWKAADTFKFPSGDGFYLGEKDGVRGYNISPTRGADTFFPFKSGDIQYYRCVENIGPSKTVTKTFSEIGFVPKIVICMNGDSALLRYIDDSFAISIGAGLVLINNLDSYPILELTEEKITFSIKWHAEVMSYNIIFLG